MSNTPRRPVLALALPLVSLTALLSACNSSEGPGPGVSGLTPLTLSGNLRPAAGLAPQGVPFKDDGSPVVTSVRVQVFPLAFLAYDPAIEEPVPPLRFDANNNADPNGTRTFIELTPGAPTATVRVPPGTYSFFSFGYSQGEGGSLVAVGRLEGQEVAGAQPKAVSLPLHTVFGRATLESALPVTYVVPGQTLDLLLSVQTDEVGGRRYLVPLDDYNVNYQFQDGGTVVAQSKLGARVTVPATPPGPTFTARALVGAYDAIGLLKFRDNPEFTRPVYSVARLGVDLQRPDLVACRVAPRGVNNPSAITGSVGDNVGLERLELYEGPVLYASTDSDGSGGVKKVTVSNVPFNPNVCPAGLSSTNFTIGIEGSPAAQTVFTLIATDTSGNETRQTFNVERAGTRTDSVSLGQGPAAGGTPITVIGFGFDATSRVYVGDAQATGVVVDPSGTSLTATTPPGSPDTISFVRVQGDGPVAVQGSYPVFRYLP